MEEGMADKTILEVYLIHKESRTSALHLHDNSRKSALLACARAGSPPTKVHKTLHYIRPEPTNRNRYGVYEETMEHVIFECNHYHHTTDDLCNRDWDQRRR